MIIGIGTDITDLARIERLLKDKAGERFLRRILTEDELALLAGRPNRRVEFAAGRFAAKEAVSKAFGCGIGETIGFHDIEILPDRLGKPECRLSERARTAFDLNDTAAVHITISHSAAYAVAFAVWEKIGAN